MAGPKRLKFLKFFMLDPGLLSPGGTIATDIPLSEFYALSAIYHGSQGNGWTTNTNWLLTTTAGGWFRITVAGGKVTKIDLYNNNLIGTIPLNPATFTTLSRIYMYTNASLYFSTTDWTFPATFTQLYITGTKASGDIASWTFGAALTLLQAATTLLTVLGPTSIATAVGLTSIRLEGCGMTQTMVDQLIDDIYQNRANWTFATPVLNIGGSNAAPSGTYQDTRPPVTGKEKIFTLVNDPELEGFNKWTITYTA